MGPRGRPVRDRERVDLASRGTDGWFGVISGCRTPYPICGRPIGTVGPLTPQGGAGDHVAGSAPALERGRKDRASSGSEIGAMSERAVAQGCTDAD